MSPHTGAVVCVRVTEFWFVNRGKARMAVRRHIWTPRERLLSDEGIFWNRQLHRRVFLESVGRSLWGTGVALSFAGLGGCSRPTLSELDAAGVVEKGKEFYPAKRNGEFEYGREETARADAAEFCNFYEFTTSKSVYLHVGEFQPVPWTFQVSGLCKNPLTFDLDDVYKAFTLEERAYRHRCVETWAMCIPWTGFPLAELIKLADPQPEARYVRFVTFLDPQLTAQMGNSSFPWPYTESLTLAEATNPLAFIATGVYGRPLPKQHGAPIRLVVPWKYGFKSIKSIVTLELTSDPPSTFWNTMNPLEYGTVANVEPEVPHPRWSQQWEWMLGTRERFQTVKYNGYGDYVAALYE